VECVLLGFGKKEKEEREKRKRKKAQSGPRFDCRHT